MKKVRNMKLLSYVGRFILIHIITYTIVASLFLIFQEALPASSRIALEFFGSYRPFGIMTTFGQVLRGGALALILYPFYNTIVKRNRGWLILFGALWGLALLGSVEPIPGSIEGMIYTTTTFMEHIFVLIAGVLQVLLFSWMFLRWEIGRGEKRNPLGAGGIKHE